MSALWTDLVFVALGILIGMAVEQPEWMHKMNSEARKRAKELGDE